MMHLPLAISILIAAPSAAPEVATPRSEATAIQPLVLRVPASDFEPLRAALANRLPTVSVHPHRAAVLDALRGRDLLFAELVPTHTESEVRLVVILHDGRSFERNFTVDEVDRVHSIATTLANTIAAIREERIEPTRTDAEIPAPDPEPVDPPQPQPTAAPVKPRSPEPIAPVAEPPAPVKPMRRHELGLAAHGGPLLGVGPHGVAIPQGGAGLDVDFRFPVGVLLGVGARYATRALDRARVHRIAVTIGSGYDLRRDAFELRLAAAFVIEPWLVTDGGTKRSVRDQHGKKAGPLVGAVVSVAPGWYWRRNDRAPVALRLGMRAQLQLAALTTSGIANVRLVEGSDAPRSIARMGGAELMLGLDAALWFTLRRG